MLNKAQTLTVKLVGDFREFNQASNTLIGSFGNIKVAVAKTTDRITTGIGDSTRTIKLLTSEVDNLYQHLNKVTLSAALPPTMSITSHYTTANNELKKQEDLLREQKNIHKQNAADIKDIQDKQLNESRRRVELQNAMAVNSLDKERIAHIKHAHERERIEENLQAKLRSIREQVKGGTISKTQGELLSIKTLGSAQNQQLALGPSDVEFNRVDSGFKKIINIVWKYYIAYQAVNLVANTFRNIVSGVIPAGVALDAVKSSLISTMGSAAGAESALKALRIEANRTGIEVGVVRNSFKLFQASTSLAGASLKDTWKMFTNMNTVITALHLSVDDANNVFLALSQIFNKSKVQSEELVKQLGNLLPGAFASFAAATNRTSEQLSKDMQNGTVYARDTMLQFTDFIANRFAPSFASASMMLNADIGRMKNSFTLMEEAIYKTSNTTIQNFVQKIINLSEGFIKLIEDTERFTNVLNTLGNIITSIAIGGLVKYSLNLAGYVAGMSAATVATNALGAAIRFAFSPAVIVGAITLIGKSISDLLLQFNDTELRVNNLINKTALLKGQQTAGKAGELQINVENDPQVQKWKETLSEIEKLQATSQEKVNKLRKLGLDKSAKESFTTEGRVNLLKTIDEMRSVLQANKSKFLIPFEFDDKKFIMDFIKTGDMPASTYNRYAEVRKAYLKIQIESTKENAKESDLIRQKKEDEAEIASRLNVTEKVQQSELLKAKSKLLELDIERNKQAGNQLKTQKLLKEQLELNRQTEVALVNEQKNKLLNELEASDKQIAERDARRAKRKEAIAKGLPTDIQEDSQKSLDDDIRRKAENLKTRTELDLKSKGEMAEVEAKYLKELATLNKQFASDNNDIIGKLEKLAQQSIARFTASAKTSLHELSMEMQEFEWRVQENATGLSINEIAQKRIEYLKKQYEITDSILQKEIQTRDVVKEGLTYIENGKIKPTQTLLDAMIHQESGGRTSAVSNKGAAGLMQLMPATAARYGVTNRFDPQQSIKGGSAYMSDLLTMFKGDVSLALAGYNAGEGAVKRYGNKIPPYQETQNYVASILSNLKNISKENVALGKQETDIYKSQEQLLQNKYDLEKSIQQVLHQETVDLLAYKKLYVELQANQLDFEGKYEEAARIRQAEVFKAKRDLILPGTGKTVEGVDPEKAKELVKLEEERAVAMDVVSHSYNQIRLSAEAMEQAELRITQSKQIGLTNEFQAMEQLSDVRKEHVKLAEEELKKIESKIALLGKEQKLEYEKQKRKLDEIKYPERAYIQKYLQEGNSLQSVNFISKFMNNLDILPKGEQADIAYIRDTVKDAQKQEEQIQQIRKNSLLAQTKNYAEFYQGVFSLGSSTTQALLDFEIQTHGVRSAQAKRAFALNKAMKMAEITMAIAKGITESLGQGGIQGMVMAGIVGAMGAIQLATVAAQQMPSAHSGLTNVPETGTYVLKAGERVLAPEQNKDLTTALRDRTGKLNVNTSGQVNTTQTINSNPTVNISLTQTEGQSSKEMAQIVSAEVVRAIAKQEIYNASRPGNVIGRTVKRAA